MTFTHYVCPDKVEIPIVQCLEKCRMGQRCLTRPTLQVIAGMERVWDGVPHVTQLLNGTMHEYLKIKHDYAEPPSRSAYRLLGISHHRLIEGITSTDVMAEVHLNIGWVQGTFDLLEKEADGTWTLTDYKTYGSYPVKKMLAGNYYPADYQLNMYRIMAEQGGVIKVGRMQLQVTVRDSGTKQGIDREMLLITIPHIADSAVLLYFKDQAARLQQALKTGQWTEVCNNEENWDTVRCMRFCPVAKHCTLGRQVLG